MAPNGFLRSNDDARLNDVNTTTAASGSPKSPRPSRDGRGDTAASGSVITRAWPEASGASASAANRDGAQMS